MKEDKGKVKKVEEQIGKAWEAFCKEHTIWEIRKFDCPVIKLLHEIVKELTDGKGVVYWCWDERFVFERNPEKRYIFREHRIEVNDEAVGYIHEKYYDDGTYTLDIEEINHEKVN